MALPVNIDDIINAKTVESVRIEFKKGWNPHNILRSVCAFLNDIHEHGGGYIIVGIEEADGTPILPPHGIEQKELDAIQREFFKLCKDNLVPNAFPPIEIINFQGRYIIVIWVTTGEERPYVASTSLAKNASMTSYVRQGSVTKEADANQDRQLRELAAFKHFDDKVNTKATLADLDLGLIQSYLSEIKSELYAESLKLPIEELAIKMQIARGPREYIKPLNVGLLMFSKEPHKFFEGCVTNIVEFEDEGGAEYSEKIFKGPVHVQIRDILSYLNTNIIRQHVKKIDSQAESITFFNYPFKALEEVVVNSMYHRSYEEARPNEIRIYKTNKADSTSNNRRIEVRSFPGPLPPIDEQALIQLRFTSRTYRNIKLGDWLKSIHLTEKYATGIPRVLRALEVNGSPKPLFWTDETKSEFLVRINIHEDTPQDFDSLKPVALNVLSDTQQRILENIKGEPVSMKKLISSFDTNIKGEIEYLISENYMGRKKVIFSNIVFITEKGIEALKHSF